MFVEVKGEKLIGVFFLSHTSWIVLRHVGTKEGGHVNFRVT